MNLPNSACRTTIGPLHTGVRVDSVSTFVFCVPAACVIVFVVVMRVSRLAPSFLPKGGSLLEQPFAVSGSGSAYALGYCDDNLRPGLTRYVTWRLALPTKSLGVVSMGGDDDDDVDDDDDDVDDNDDGDDDDDDADFMPGSMDARAYATGESASRTCRGPWRWRSAETALRGASSAFASFLPKG